MQREAQSQSKKETLEVPREIIEGAIEIATQEQLTRYGEGVQQKIGVEAKKTIAAGEQGVEMANASIGLANEEVRDTAEALKIHDQLKTIQSEIMRGSEEAQRTITLLVGAVEVLKPEEQKLERIPLKTDYPPEALQTLRDPLRVGKEQYGAGLVNTYQKEGAGLGEQEQAQEEAMKALEEKIEANLVDPESIGADMLHQLEVRESSEHIPEKFEAVLDLVHQELDIFVKKQFLTEQESALIKSETGRYFELYREAFPQVSPEKIYELVRDNARKVAYQTTRDKEVFSGSDHGTRHILEGNMKFAEQMFKSLEGHNVPVSTLDKVLIHQVIIDHDLGYTCGCAQAKKGFEASKDHPLFSTKFIEANKDYYVDKFGEAGYQAIRDAVLYHSYPTAEYQNKPDPDTGINIDLIRSISSTVDSLGVSAEAKTPAFFRKPESITVLMKIKLAMEVSPLKDKKGKPMLDPALMEQFKLELAGVAGQEKNSLRQEGYKRAIEDFFNEFTAETTLGHYTGVVEQVGVTEQEGKLLPHVEMRMSRIHALLGDMFGGELETKAFAKAMKDFGITKSDLGQFGATLETARRLGARPEPLKFQSERGVFEIPPEFIEDSKDEFSDIREKIADVYNLSIRAEINAMLDLFEKDPERAKQSLDKLKAKFESSVTSKTTAKELEELLSHIESLNDASPTQEKDASGRTISKSEEARTRLKQYLTTKEREFLGIHYESP